MTLTVLQTKDRIAVARSLMIDRGQSALDSPISRFAKRIGIKRGVAIGDIVKSWDVEATVSFLQSNVGKSAAIADIGCFASEVLVSLSKMGYRNLTGVDLNPHVVQMPFAHVIRYVVSDFTQTPFDDCSFDAITSISVIEHGYNPEKLLAEVARLLRGGGFFIASFDYWPDKIQTDGTTFFGMPWLIFAREDVRDLIATASTHGLEPVGKLHFEAKEQPIECAGKKYTFAHLILQKRKGAGG